MNFLINRVRHLMRATASCDAGFSIIEVLVATVVSSIIMLMIYSAHRTIMTATHELTKIAAYYERINLAVAMMDRDISCAYINRNNKDVCFIAENNTGQPYHGKLNFVTINHQSLSISADPSREIRRSDVSEVGYFLKAARDRPDYYMLMKREDISIDQEPESGGTESIVLENIQDLKVEFKLRNTWVDSWDSRRYKKTPEAVRISLKMKNYKGNEEDFSFVSFLNMTK